MEQNQADILSESLFQLKHKRRKDLLPWWVKVFAWIFLIIGAIGPPALVFGLLGFSFEISLYGIETNEPSSIIGIALLLMFTLKGITAYGLLKEKSWAVTLGIMDAITGIIFCCFAMIYPFINPQPVTNFTIRLELALLIPYLIKMIRIRSDWEKSIYV